MSEAEGIRIFLRIRPTVSARQGELLSNPNNTTANLPCQYEVDHSFTESTLRLHLPRRESNEVVNNSTEDYVYSFRRVFEPQSTQQEVFDTVARESVISVLDGYNSTVFAYGQTGSGKTYSVTGGTDGYDERGIIPRALALIYEEITQRRDWNWTVSISYLQIYNGVGQDLLNHGRDARRMEDLPSVSVHESEEEVVLRGLEQHYAATLAEALNLLFLGDTNRLYCETPMNKTSSRSHCVFAVRLEAREVGSSAKVRQSKLNLVDLAGSERVSRSGGVQGTTLTEAKYINLSLHFLEHVIVALSEQARGRRDHVPFRNSFLTMVLRDSLGRNCRTAMLATAHVAQGMLPETISTCQFAQRVALIKQQAQVNEEVDPAVLVRRLKAEIVQLRDRLAFYEKRDGGEDDAAGGVGADRRLGEDERVLCRAMVRRFVDQSADDARIEGFEGDLARIYFCFQVLKEMVRSASQPAIAASRAARQVTSGESAGESAENSAVVEELRMRVDALQQSLQHKENELNTMLEVLHRNEEGGMNSVVHDGLVNVSERKGNAAANVSASMAHNSSTPLSHNNHNHNNSISSSSSSSAALTHVATLRNAGHISDAEAIAASEFLRSKEARLAEVYNLSALTDANLLQDRARAFEAFKGSYRNYDKVEQTKRELKERYTACKQTAQQLNRSVDEIKRVKTQVQRVRVGRAVEGGGSRRDPQGHAGVSENEQEQQQHEDVHDDERDATERVLLNQLTAEKARYNALAAELRTQKEHIDGMHAFIKRSQEQLTHDYEEWLAMRHRQIELAVGRTGAGESANGNPHPCAAVHHDAEAMGARKDVNVSRDQEAAGQHVSASAAQDTTQIHSRSLHSYPTSRPDMYPPTRASVNHVPRTHEASSAAASSADVSKHTRDPLPALVKAQTCFDTEQPAPAAAYSSHDTSSLARVLTSTRRSDSARTQPSVPSAPRQSTPFLTPPPRQLEPLSSRHPPVHAGGGALGSWAMAVPQDRNSHPPPAVSQTSYSVSAAPVVVSGESVSAAAAAAAPPYASSRNVLGQDASMTTTATSMMNSRGAVRSSTVLGALARASAPGVEEDRAAGVNPYAPAHRSTGNLAADEQLAALYKVRDTMRQQML